MTALRELTLAAAMAAAAGKHVFQDRARCVCSFAPATAADWERHRMTAAALAVADWLLTQSSPTLAGDPFILAATWAADVVKTEARRG
jgi:hypothetical protein